MRAKHYLKTAKCACSRPAVRFCGSDPVCKFCAQIEKRMSRFHKEAVGKRRAER